MASFRGDPHASWWGRFVGAALLLALGSALPGACGPGPREYAPTDSEGGGGQGGDGASGGNQSGGAGNASGGGDGSGGAPPDLDDPCSESGVRACDATDPKQTLICSGGSWASNGGCDSDKNCDPQSGLCAPIVIECAELEAGDRYCSTDDEVMECDENLVSSSLIDACPDRCIVAGESASCVPASCGDGVPDAGEDCDDGDGDNDDDCTELCMAPTCGDGFEQTGEDCDDGDADNDDECTEACAAPSCGDGFLQADEVCDDGNDVSEDGCSSACAFEITQLVAGASHTCALRGDGQVKCWGLNDNGQLGLGDVDDRGDEPGEMGSALLPIDLGTGRRAKYLSAGTAHTCALLDDDSVKCWGTGVNGQTGQGDVQIRGDGPGEMGDALPPLSLGTSRSARFLDSGAFYSCAVLDNDFLKCWGMNSGGQLGQGDVETRGDEIGEMGDALLVVNLGIGRTAQALSSGAAYTCAVLDDASLKCWGTNNTGALGLGDLENRGDEGGEMGDDLPALDLGTGRTVQTVAVGIGNACALLDDDTVKCWGSNNAGALGLGDTEARGDAAGEMGDALPVVDLGSGGPARALAAGNSFACAVFEDDAVKCWGLNTSGQLGLGNSSGRGDVPGEMGDDLPEVNLGTGRSVRSLTVGSTHCCALLDDNSVKCWGNATNGKLGTGDVAHRGDGANEMGNDLPVVELW